MLKKDLKFLELLIEKYNKTDKSDKIRYPLLEKGFTSEDVMRGIEVLLSRNITMSNITKRFELEFAKFVGSKFALMVNSGSSANLLAAFALVNPKKKNRLKIGDKFLVPATCWSTSLWPMIQCGLQPKFVDVNINTFCLDENIIKAEKDKKVKAIMNIHILGNSPNMNELTKFTKKNNIFLIEDTCEALGSKYKSKHLGTFGDFGTYSFYYSHQITSGEGGMVVCQNKEDFELIHTLRAHGWDRGLNTSKKNNFNFINSGFNLRPMDITAAIGLNQFKRINKMIKTRAYNRKIIIESLKKADTWNNQIDFLQPNKKINPSWFGLPILIDKKFINKKQKYLDLLSKSGIETRPIISGNFLNQPAAKLYNLNKKKEYFKNAEEIDKRGFFIGLHTSKINRSTVKLLTKKLLLIDKV